MSLTIQLPANIENGLREDAQKQGLSLEKYISMLLINRVSKQTPQLTTEESLLQKIKLNGLSQSELEQFAKLEKLRKMERLTLADHEELKVLINKIEIAHAERMKYVIDLAQIRGVGIHELMLELGIKAKEHE
jgi:hypothetical protein